MMSRKTMSTSLWSMAMTVSTKRLLSLRSQYSAQSVDCSLEELSTEFVVMVVDVRWWNMEEVMNG